MAARAFLFDLDGTLWDSYSFYAKVLTDAAGGSFSKRMEQLSSGHSIVSMCNSCGISSARFRSLCVDSAADLALYPGTLECLDGLGRRGYSLGVVTSLSGPLAERLLEAVQLAERFQVVIHPGNCKYRKPRPEPLLMALELLKAVPEKSWYVGDKEADAAAAEAAGMEFAWASYGYGDECPNSTLELRRIRDLLAI